MSGPKRNPDKLNTIGIVVVGICGAVMVYVSIIALQAFYMNDTSELQHTKDYAGLERTAASHKADEIANISQAGTNTGAPTFHIPVDTAMKLVVEDAKKDPSHLIPSLPASTKATIEPVFGRPKPLGGAAPAPEAGQGSGQGSAAAPAQGSGAGSAAAPAQGSGAGSAAPAGTMQSTPTNPAGAAGTSAPQTPTGSGPGGGAASPSKAAATGTGGGSATQPK